MSLFCESFRDVSSLFPRSQQAQDWICTPSPKGSATRSRECSLPTTPRFTYLLRGIYCKWAYGSFNLNMFFGLFMTHQFLE